MANDLNMRRKQTLRVFSELYFLFPKGNWMKEFKMWCPSIRAVRMGGTKEERLHFEKEHLPKDPATGKYNWDVLVTSYEGMLKERSKLAKIKWRYLIIDEAHRIKNENSSLSKAVRMVNVDHRLLITGTPLQVRRNKNNAESSFGDAVFATAPLPFFIVLTIFFHLSYRIT